MLHLIVVMGIHGPSVFRPEPVYRPEPLEGQVSLKDNLEDLRIILLARMHELDC